MAHLCYGTPFLHTLHATWKTPDLTGFGPRVRPAEALRSQGTASWPVRGRSVFTPPLFCCFLLCHVCLSYFNLLRLTLSLWSV